MSTDRGLSDLSLFLLIGGESRRMGSPKTHLRELSSGKTLLDLHLEKWTKTFASVQPLGPDHLPDPEIYRGQGPLAALLSACKSSESEWFAFVAIDYPFLTPELFQNALTHCEVGRDLVVYQDLEGREQWLAALYHRQILAQVESSLRSGNRSMWKLCQGLKLTKLSCQAWAPELFLNLNTPQEAKKAGFS